MRISSSFLNLLTILLIGLKLTGYIDWPWFVVLLPMFFGWIILFSLLTLFLIAVLFGATVNVKEKE